MIHSKHMIRTGALSAMSILSAAGSAMAQDPGLSMTLDRSSIASGESVNVQVAGRFPTSAFALAQVDLDVFASVDAWTWASSGALAGASVLNAGFAQTHMPSAGLFADAANPLHIWSGTYQPSVVGPAFLRLRAEADFFSYYPSDLTSSTAVVADPLSGRQYLWVDPVALPGEGAGMEVRPDGLVVATPQEQAILIGLLLPAVQKVREAAVRIDPMAAPTSLSAGVIVETGGSDVVMDEMTLNFEEIKDASGATWYQMDVAASFAYAGDLCLLGPDGQQICIPAATASAPIVRFDRLPTCLVFSIEEDDITGEDIIVAGTCGDGPFFIEIPGVYKGLTSGPIEVRVMPIYIEFGGVKGDVVEMHGLPSGPAGAVGIEFSHTASPTDPCDADFDGDGALTIFDFLAFQNAFDRGLRSADFNGDGRLDLFDFLAFQNAFAAGCK